MGNGSNPGSFERLGSWRRVDDLDRRLVAGRLSYDRQNGVSLWTADRWPFNHGSEDEDLVLIGDAEGVPWTLVGCSFRTSSSTGTDYYVRYALEGVAIDHIEELRQFDEIRLEFHGLWDIAGDAPRSARDAGRSDLVLQAALGDSTVELRSSLVDLDIDTEGATAVRDQLRFVARVTTPTSFEHLSSQFVGPLADLVTLAVRQATAIRSCELAGPATTVESRLGRTNRAFAVAHWDQVGTGARGARLKRPAFQIPNDPERFANLVSTWFALHDRIDLPIGLRTADLVADMTFASTRFLLVAQALEALHRRLQPMAENAPGKAAREAALAAVASEHRSTLRTLLLHAHEPTFRTRISALRDEAEPELGHVVGTEISRAVGLIVDNRNAVTHWDPTTDEPSGLLLIALRQVADVLFDLVVLKRLKLTEAELDAAVNAYRTTNVEYWLKRALDHHEQLENQGNDPEAPSA